MENEQDSSQPKSFTKSYRKRQRRKEAAALQKQAFRSVLNKAESSIQSQDCQSETHNNILKENTNSAEILKNTSELSTSQLNSQVIETKKLRNLPNNLYKEQESSHVTPEENKIEVDKTSTTSRSKRRRNRKKAVQPETVSEAQEKNIKIKESQSSTDVPKSGVEFTLHHLCSWEDYISGKDSLIPSNTFTCRDNDNLAPAEKKYSDKSVVVEKIGNTCQESSAKIRKREEEEKNKSLKDTAISQDLGVVAAVMSESDRLLGSLNRSKNVQVSEDLDKTSVTCISDNKGDCLTDKTNSGLTSKTEKKEDNSKISNNTVDFREEQSQSSYLFQQTGIYSSHITSKTHRKGDIEASSAAPNNIKETVIVESIGSEMNKSGEKIDKGITGKRPVDKNESPKNKSVVTKTTNKPEMRVTQAVEGGGKEILDKSRDQVKAEREARKASKMAKKQKETKTTSDIKEAGEAVVVPPPIKDVKEDKGVQGVTPTKSDLTEPIQSNESNNSTKSKAELRAERRAKQEAQRAAKVATASATSTKSLPIKANTTDSSHAPKAPPAHVNKLTELKYPLTKVKAVRREQGAKLLSRLGWEESRLQKRKEDTLTVTQSIHPAIVQLGTRFTNRIISGSNARCLAYVQAIKKAIQDYQTPPQKELGRDLESRLLAPSLDYLKSQRPHAVSVTNATRFLKWQLTQLQQHCSSDKTSTPSPDSKNLLTDQQAKLNLIEGLDSYIWEKIEVAEKAVCITLKDKIKDGDVILTYGCSHLLQQILIGAKKAETKFKVVVVDGRPWREGREMLRCLVAVGIPCSYVLLSAASSVMRQVNKVLLGAHALLSNGYVMSRVGVSQVALLASAHNVPVLVACETHKFCERVQSDSFVYNEMGEPDGLAQLLGGEEGPLSGWRNLPCLSLLNLSYDVTPPELVTAVATELAVLPCTSVPVVLRVRPTEPVNSRH